MAEVPAGTDARFVVWDVYLSKSLFANGSVVQEGEEPLLLDPSPGAWKEISTDALVLKTALGDWNFKMESDAAGWRLRSTIEDASWRPERLKTFTFLTAQFHLRMA